MSTPRDFQDDPVPPRVSVARMQQLAAAELSQRARLAYTAFLLVTAAAAVTLLSLWMTEPSLPGRTHAAFALLVGIDVAWAAYSGWVLARRRVMLAGHRVVAGRMAVVFCALFVAGALAVAYWTPPPSAPRAPIAAAGLGVVMLAVAVAVLGRARRRFARLLERRATLEQQLAAAGAIES